MMIEHQNRPEINGPIPVYGVPNPNFRQLFLLQSLPELSHEITVLRGRHGALQRGKITALHPEDQAETLQKIRIMEARKRLLMKDRGALTIEAASSRLEAVEEQLKDVADAIEGNDYYVRRGFETRREILLRRIADLTQSPAVDAPAQVPVLMPIRIERYDDAFGELPTERRPRGIEEQKTQKIVRKPVSSPRRFLQRLTLASSIFLSGASLGGVASHVVFEKSSVSSHVPSTPSIEITPIPVKDNPRPPERLPQVLAPEDAHVQIQPIETQPEVPAEINPIEPPEPESVEQ